MAGEFHPSQFLEKPEFEIFDALAKADLVSLAKACNITFKHSVKKQGLKNALIDHLVQAGKFEVSILGKKIAVDNACDDISSLQLKIKEMELRAEHEREQMRLEMKLQMQKVQKEREEWEYKMQELKFQEKKDKESKFDLYKNQQLVPEMDELNVDQFFQHFEKLASLHKWPKSQWALLVQKRFHGKAAEVYAQLSLTESTDYTIVKTRVLKAYQLVPEFYRQKFRQEKKKHDQTFVEFARSKEQNFNQWVLTKNIGEDYTKLRQLMLLEEFKRQIHEDIRMYLEELKVNDLYEAAKIADEYAMNHKLPEYRTSPSYKKNFSKGQNNNRNSSDQNKNDETPKSGTKNTMETKNTMGKQGTCNSGKPKFSCYTCGEPGHRMKDCKLVKKPQSGSKATQKEVGCVTTFSKQGTKVVGGNGPPEINSKSNTDKISAEFKPFVSNGSVSLDAKSEGVPVKIVRDTCSGQSMILKRVLEFDEQSATGSHVLIQGIGMEILKVPLHVVNLKSPLLSGSCEFGVRNELPIRGVDVILGNDLAGDRVHPEPIVSDKPCVQDTVTCDSEIFPSCAVTRAMSAKAEAERAMGTGGMVGESESQNCVLKNSTSQNSKENSESDDLLYELENTFLTAVEDQEASQTRKGQRYHHSQSDQNRSDCDTSLSRAKLIDLQRNDQEIAKFHKRVIALDDAHHEQVCFYMNHGVLMRKWRPIDSPLDEEWNEIHQIVIPPEYREEILNLGHDCPLAGHLGVKKTKEKILQHFWWPTLWSDVTEYCRTCHTCQVVGKPNQRIPRAPLHPIPAFGEPFSHVIIDCVGPLPKTRAGNQYLLTIMCTATRFPEAIPLRNIRAHNIVKALTKFFTFVGLPQTIQSDQGSNFTSGLFKQVMKELGIRHNLASSYHPESQGALERFHQTLKTMLKSYCLEFNGDWDEGVHLVLFAAREAVQDSLGFSPFQLVFGHRVRGPLKLLKERWLGDDDSEGLLQYISKFKVRLKKATEIAQKNLQDSQETMKTWYDKKASERSFNPGDQVLVLFPVRENPLQAKFSGPYTVRSKVSDVNYVIDTPGRRKKTQLCHINMLKPYHVREMPQTSCAAAVVQNTCSSGNDTMEHVYSDDQGDDVQPTHKFDNYRLNNSDILSSLESKVDHLKPHQQHEIVDLIKNHESLFPDTPSICTVAQHDIVLQPGTQPIKQHPYRLNPHKQEHLKKEIDYMLTNDIIEPSKSDWSSPCIMVPKPDGSFRVVADMRKVNLCSKGDSFPIPRMDDVIDRVGGARFVSKFDLLKGYWQVPLSDQAKEITAFCTPQGLFQYKKMCFGLKNAPATFQRMINEVISGIPNCEAYVDDLIVYSNTWSEHVQTLRQLFDRLAEANLTINLAKSEFGHATVTYLGHEVGQGHIKPIYAKVEAINAVPPPKTKRELMRFLGMVGYYRKFCPNFATISNPLTDLLKKDHKFVWSEKCDLAFSKIKTILTCSPVLQAPNFDQPFSLSVDASDVGAGALLSQKGSDDVDHPVCYYSKKFNKHQRNYATIEKECLALVLAIQHFEVYLIGSMHPIKVFTDHNPLVFLNRMKNKNRKIMRWAIFLQEFDLQIQHVAGKDNIIPDALSRV